MKPSEKISREVLSWNGTTSAPHKFGGIEFRLNKRELGHLHGDVLLDIPFPMKVRNELIASGRALVHRFEPQSGWISFPIENENDVNDAIVLLKMSFDLAVEQYQKRKNIFIPKG